jgi:holo-[acyl-carrier-protein] synthase
MVKMGLVMIGVDIVSIDRISKNIDKESNKFINRVYTQDEIDFCKNKINTAHHFAGRFAGKEAVSKALKLNWKTGINWRDIEILSNADGIPKVIAHGELKKIIDERNINDIQISISHEKNYAVAFAIVKEGNKDG